MKICSKCLIVKDLSEFYYDRSKKDEVRNSCIECDSIYRRLNKEKIKEYQAKYNKDNSDKKKSQSFNYRKNNKGKISERNKFYYNKNKEKISEESKEKYEKDKIEILKSQKEKYHNADNKKERNKIKNDKSKEYRKKYYLKNRNRIISYSTEYYFENIDKVKNTKKEHRKKHNNKRSDSEKLKRVNDPLFKVTESIRSSIRKSIKKLGFTKKSKTHKILGCSFEEFKLYLESKFEPWMSWNNYGLYNGELNYGWDIDHVMPLSSANSEEEILRLNHFSNLQPLCSKINRDIKSDRI